LLYCIDSAFGFFRLSSEKKDATNAHKYNARSERISMIFGSCTRTRITLNVIITHVK
jgi:hypothetical protein